MTGMARLLIVVDMGEREIDPNVTEKVDPIEYAKRLLDRDDLVVAACWNPSPGLVAATHVAYAASRANLAKKAKR